MVRPRITGTPFPEKTLEEKGFAVDLVHYGAAN
jgi:hypothetical protein